MAEIVNVAIVFVRGDRGELDEREREVLSIGADTPTYIMSYGTNLENDGTLQSMVTAAPEGNTVVHLTEDGKGFLYRMTDLMTRFTGTITVDITYASAFHAALAVQFGLRRRVSVYYTRQEGDRFKRKLMNVHLLDYARLDTSSQRIVAAIVNEECHNVSDIVSTTGFSDKKVYRLVQAMVTQGYITSKGEKKQKVLTLNGDQEMMYTITGCLNE